RQLHLRLPRARHRQERAVPDAPGGGGVGGAESRYAGGHAVRSRPSQEELIGMLITRKAISRRAVLRGVGATVSLPLLDSMVPALPALDRSTAAPPRRLGFVYIPNGANEASWKPRGEAPALELSPTLAPLEPVRDHLVVVSGLRSFNGDG